MSERHLPHESAALAEYAASGSAAAFRRVVESTMPLVLGTALRRTQGCRAMAEDIAQTVFIDLARKAKAVRGATLSAWLHRHTCFTVSKFLRSERRRAERERIAAEQTAPPAAASDTERLDEVLLGMPENDREALFLRCVEGRTHEEVAEALGISRAAAQKRSERAMERLRALYRSDVTVAGFLALLAPPAADAETLAHQFTGAATAAADGKSPAFFAQPVAGALLGAAAAITLSIVPLSLAWREASTHRSNTAVSPAAVEKKPAPASVPATSTALTTPPGSPDDVVTALLSLTDRYGLGKAAWSRGKAILVSIPREWIHDIVMGLDRRMPAACRGTRWHLKICETTTMRWKPRRVPGDLLAARKALSFSDSEAMYLACAEADPAGTLRYLRSGKAEDVAWLAVLQSVAKSTPGEFPALLDAAPRLNYIDSWNSAGMSRIKETMKDPAVRRAIMEQLPAMKDLRRRLTLERVLYSAETVELRMIRVDAIADPVARAHAATAVADQTTSSLEWWASLVPRDQQPVLGAVMVESNQFSAPPDVALTWLERMGEATGGPEFDRLRCYTAKHYSVVDGVPYPRIAGIANRITDPGLRIRVLGEILYHGYSHGDWKRGWMEQNLKPEEQASFAILTSRPPP